MLRTGNSDYFCAILNMHARTNRTDEPLEFSETNVRGFIREFSKLPRAIQDTVLNNVEYALQMLRNVRDGRAAWSEDDVSDTFDIVFDDD
ncbi:hypothetical protein ACFL26_01390 [Patescibacteria group bacterium]